MKQLPFYLSEADPPAKRAIMVAALKLFASRGIDGVTIRDIAKETGYSNPALFRHFKTKDELALLLFEACYRRTASTFRGPERTLREVLQRALELIETSPEGVHYLLENLRRFWRDLPKAARERSILGSMRNLVVAEQAAGRIESSIDPSLAAAIVLGSLAQMARMTLFKELPCPPSALANDLFRLLDGGLGP